MSQHACKVDSSLSFNELSERVCSHPIEKDSRYCAAQQLEDFRIVKKAAIPGNSGHHPNCGRNPLKPASDQEGRNAALVQWWAAISQLRLIVEQADNSTPAELVKRVEEFMPELRKAAMRTVIHPASCNEKEE
jgi:hypothetical protein